MGYEIGQVLPLDGGRGITAGPEQDPAWFALVVPPMKEAATRDMLKRKGVHAFFPERDRKYHIRGRRFVRKLPIVTGIVYARFTRAPQWDVLRYRRLIQGVFSSDGAPIEIPSEIIREVQGLAADLERLERAKAEMAKLRVGDRARVVRGPLEGYLVEVTAHENGRVWFETLTGIKIEANESFLDKDC